MKILTKNLLALTTIGVALLGCSESSNNPAPATAQSQSIVDYNIKVDDIESIIADQGKITFSRLSICLKTELECQPVILVFDGNNSLVHIFKAQDTERIKVSAVSEDTLLDIARNSDIQARNEHLNFTEIQKNFYEFNNQALSRCRSTRGWDKMTSVNETPRSILYIHLVARNIKNPHLMFRLDTNDGSIELAQSKEILDLSNVEAPFFIINAKDEHGHIRQDNALIHLEHQHEECIRAYKFLNLSPLEFNSEIDQRVSDLADHAIQRETRHYDFIDPLFPSIKYSEIYLKSSLEWVKATH